jgi:hypothetical protein
MLLRTNRNVSSARRLLAVVAEMDTRPPYRSNWDLDADTNLESGVIYMAQMNPREPACFTMLGIVAWKKMNYHLAAAAFDKAIALGSPQAELLKGRADDLRQFIGHSEEQKRIRIILLTVAAIVVVGVLALIATVAVKLFRKLSRLSK